MDKPEFAPNGIGEIMNNCWKANPKERPTFGQLEVKISDFLETAVSEHYLDLNFSYSMMNEETKKASSKDTFGLLRELDSKPMEPRSRSLLVKSSVKRKFSVQSLRKMTLGGIPKTK